MRPSSNKFVWDGLKLKLGRRVVATVQPDARWPGMWRVHCGGKVSDMLNLSRAKDTAASIALSELNAHRKS
jgi:hypothetical protein